MRLRANCVRAEIGEGTTINKVVADGGVVVNATTGIITGDAGTYDVGAHLITVTGKVVLTSDKNVMRGSLLTYNVTTRQAKFSASDRRVQGLFTPAAGTTP
jgi:lipopolysaccharide export system protein LptA